MASLYDQFSGIDDYLRTLTPAEKDLHKNLIDECRKREAGILAQMEKNPELVRQYYEYLDLFFSRLKEINTTAKIAETQTEETLAKTLELYLKKVDAEGKVN